MGVVGERDAVLAFGAIGMESIAVSSPEEATAALHRLATAGVPIIFITETCAEWVPEALEKYKTMPQPAVIPIPGASGSTGFGRKKVRQNVEKAIGADILFHGDEETEKKEGT